MAVTVMMFALFVVVGLFAVVTCIFKLTWYCRAATFMLDLYNKQRKVWFLTPAPIVVELTDCYTPSCPSISLWQ